MDARTKRNALLHVSPAYEAVWGRTCESAYAEPQAWLEGVHPEDRERVRTAVTTLQARGDYDETYRIIRPDGVVRWIHSRAFPIHDTAGTVHRIVGTAEDVTGYRTLEDQLRHAQKMEAIGTLAGGIAHDFNNILAAIVGYAELSRLILKDNPEVDKHLGTLLQAASRATTLVRQILAFSRKQQSERQPISLERVVVETLDLLRGAVPSTIEFHTSFAMDTPISTTTTPSAPCCA